MCIRDRVPDTFGFNTQDGRIRSRGLEFEARGQVTSNLELIAALTLLDTKVTQAAVEANKMCIRDRLPTTGSGFRHRTVRCR